jgi:hypothetical protein
LPKFIEAFADIGATTPLFPKKCRTCGASFPAFDQYILRTEPKGHVFEDCSEVMGKPYTMMYRHCGCGNTLVLTITGEVLSWIDQFWDTVNQIARDEGKHQTAVILEFSKDLERVVLSRLP